MFSELTPTVAIALLGWIPAVIALFLVLPIRKAILSAFLLGFLFLPQAKLELPGFLPDYDRNLALHGGVLLSVMIVDLRRLLRFELRWIDLPMALFCAAPLLSSLANGLGVYDGLSGVMSRTILWGIPYGIGRVYFSDREGIRQLALAVFIGGLIYAPFCLWEIRASPQLHKTLYGFHQHSFAQTYRLGGWRPMVFLQHGIAVGFFMTSATLCGLWLWSTGVLRRTGGLNLLLLGGLLVTTVFVRSLGALFLLTLGVAVLFAARSSRSRIVWSLLVVSLVPIGYIGVRVTDTWAGEGVVPFIREHISPERAQSIEFRLQNEDQLKAKALQRPLFGWGGFGRAQLRDKRSGDLATTVDGWWIAVLGENGYFGLVGFCLMLVTPVWLFLARVPPIRWGRPQVAPGAVLAVLCALFLADCMLNAMFNPFIALALGGLGGALALHALVPRPGETALAAEARLHWGPAQVARREAVLRRALRELAPEDREAYGPAFQQLVLSLSASQVEYFLALSSDERKRVIEGWLPGAVPARVGVTPAPSGAA